MTSSSVWSVSSTVGSLMLPSIHGLWWGAAGLWDHQGPKETAWPPSFHPGPPAGLSFISWRINSHPSAQMRCCSEQWHSCFHSVTTRSYLHLTNVKVQLHHHLSGVSSTLRQCLLRSELVSVNAHLWWGGEARRRQFSRANCCLIGSQLTNSCQTWQMLREHSPRLSTGCRLSLMNTFRFLCL